MTTQLQAEANRLNATKSTGPRTPAGKAVVALDGMKHGLLSRESLVKGESEADLVDFGKRLRAQMAPVGYWSRIWRKSMIDRRSFLVFLQLTELARINAHERPNNANKRTRIPL